ncbi:MAG: protein kinase [Methylophilus sp.]|jgi:serine/threonine protein phosphatase PrpC
MTSSLSVEVAQLSDKGRKEVNQDFHATFIPQQPQLNEKGVAIALADGISSSAVSQVASEAAVKGFIDDYFCTSEAWSVKTSALRVLSATNSWLYSQTRQSQYRYDKDKGYVCTFSALVIKSTTAHIIHVGDSRIYRVHAQSLEQLTTDHRLWLTEDKSYLSRGLGIEQHLDIDYHAFKVDIGDVFLLATDGIYEYASESFIAAAIQQHDLTKAAQLILDEALAQGSTDNLTIQILRIKDLPEQNADERYQQLTELPFPPQLEPRMLFDGYQIIREIHVSSRSHVYLALDIETNTQVVIKTPSVDLRGNVAYLERFLLEDWIARRLNNVHVLKPCAHNRKRNFLYVVSEYIQGQTLAQWMLDNPKPDLQIVRNIIEQIAKGLQAFHRLEMLHQDLRPANIMIDQTGTVKIIDFGSTRVAGLAEITSPILQDPILGTAQYSAPEYFLGEEGTVSSDIYALGVIAYQMLTGKLPYGAEVARIKTRSALSKLRYDEIRYERKDVPAWVDDAIMKAVHPSSIKRYEALSEFIFDLKQPNQLFLNKTRPALIERDPVFFWKSVCIILFIVVIFLLVLLKAA